MRAMAAFMGIA